MGLIGILNVNKPSSCSSREVVNRVERLTRPARVGHAGTLDPLATGVLVVCVGQATRLIEHVQRMAKQYRATFLLGRRSATDDIEGDVTEIAGVPVPTRAMLESVLPQFLGDIQQRPPAHSAVKVAGRRAYKLARAGKVVELAPRTVTVNRLVICRYEYPELELEIECGSGTYVRSLGRDLGAALGTGAVMSALQRTAVGKFRVEDAVPVDDLTADNLPQHLQPALVAVADLPRVELNDAQINEISHGRPITMPSNARRGIAKPQADVEAVASDEWAAVNAVGKLVAILREKNAGELWPAKNFI